MLFKRIFFLFFLLVVSSCGWKPVYYQADSDNIELKNTAVVEITPVPNEEGRLFVRHLKDILNPKDEQVEKKYILNTELIETLDSDQGIIGDNTATRSTMRITANFQLIDKKNNKVMIDESAFASSSYNTLWMPYPTVTAEQATRKRLVKFVADQVGTRIAVFFNKDEQ